MQTVSLFFLFWLFAYIGFCTIGGGLVGISVMQQELIPRGLIAADEFYSMIAVSEATPGPIGVNMATFIGYRLYGVWGGVATTMGLVLPSFVVILAISFFATSLKEKPVVQKALYGIRASAAGMIAVACYSVFSITVLSFDNITKPPFIHLVNYKSAIFFVAAFACLRLYKKIHPLIIIALGAAFGYLFL